MLNLKPLFQDSNLIVRYTIPRVFYTKPLLSKLRVATGDNVFYLPECNTIMNVIAYMSIPQIILSLFACK